MKIRSGKRLKRTVARRSNRVNSSREKENWRREQEKKIPAYSTAAQRKKFWEDHQPISTVEEWESETDSSLEVLSSQVKEVLNLKK